MKKISYLFLLLFIVSACGEKAEQIVEDQKEYMQIQQVITEKIAESGVEKEIIEYTYTNPNDIFWQKAVYKDASGEIEREEIREFDKDGFPISQITKELGEVTESQDLKYCHHCYHAEEITNYDGAKEDGKMRSKVIMKYSDNYVMGKEIIKYSKDPEYKNVDGDNAVMRYTMEVMPATSSRPRGDFMPTFFIKEMKRYNDSGKVEMLMTTNVDKDNYPNYFKTDEPECAHETTEEWYKVEKDGLGNVISITGHKNKELTEIAATNTQTSFNYDGNSFVTEVIDARYNEETKEFDQYHDKQKYEWKKSGINNPKLEYYANMTNEHYCFGGKHYTVQEKRVEKFADGEKVVVVYEFSMPSETGMQPDSVKLEKTKTITTKYKIVKK